MADGSRKVAIVTGGSKGIGAAIATRLAADGFAVVVNFARDQAAADQVLAAIAQGGGAAMAVPADIARPEAMAQLFERAEAEFGRVHVLVNNAGIMSLGPVAGCDDTNFERQVAVNLGGSFRGMREAANRLADGGRIINFSSSVVGLYQPGYGVYAATKAAVEALTHVLAKETAKRGITVNAVAPGPIETELFLKDKSEGQLQAIAATNPFGRLGQPEDIACIVAFLAGPDSGWVNGQIIRANGGVI
ncbi:MAG TPA: SDR family oxidoreductase [Acidisoma sp.]|jgi:3-oxoacyl-[acyl-carrier protein] reductase|nr:SDR family oxidoreductase [Acidisoma sp.]